MMVNIGNAQLKLGNVETAADSYRQAIEADPDDALPHYRLGDLEADGGRYGKAAGYFARACELEPENWRYQGFAGTAYLQEADYARAAAYLGRSVEIFSEQPLMLYNLAVALCLDGQKESAIQKLSKAVRIDAAYARAWYLKSRIEADIGRISDAAASVGRANAHGSALSAEELQGARELLEQLSDRVTGRTEGTSPR
jgi:tetratricopeptide (TPR) repeat protein